MSEELKACQCGGVAVKRYSGADSYISCIKCGNRTAVWNLHEDAVKAWNTRAESPELTRLRTENAKLKKRVERIKVIRQCRHHGSIDWKQWGCPDCVYELRNENAELRAKLGGEWIPVEDERKPEDGQRIWVTKTTGDVIEYTFDRLQFWEPSDIAWKPVYKPEPYKPEVTG